MAVAEPTAVGIPDLHGFLEQYERDFPDSVDAFRAALSRATVFTLDGSREGEAERVESYQEVGHFVARNCDLLISVWDGGREHGIAHEGGGAIAADLQTLC